MSQDTAQPVEHLHYRDFSTNQKLTLWSTTAGFGLEHMDQLFISFAMSSIIASLHISNFAGGFISTISMFGSLVGGLFFGMLSDRIGRVRVFTWTLFIVAFATGAIYFAHNIWLVYTFRFIAGVGTGAEYGAGVTLIAESFAGKKIGKLTSLTQIGGQVGAVLSAIASAIIIPTFGWNALFLVGLVPVLLAFILRRHLKEPEEFLKTQAKRKTEKESVVEKAPILEVVKTPALAYQTFALIMMMMIQIGGYYGLMNWLPKIMQKQLHLSISGSSLWMIVTIVGMSLGMYIFGFVLDNFGPRMAFGAFLLLAAVSVYLLLVAHSAWSLLIIMMVVGFFSNGMYGGYGVVVSRLYPTFARVTANSVVSSVGKLLGGFFPPIIGWLMDKYTLSHVMMFFTAMYLFSFLIMLTIPAFRRKDIEF
ncbi:MFS transporter [Fructobacillus fructosus]|uniref:MFS family (AraJ) n=1 Tax=Fructobacillus fructosus TaxID=1631 RepID=A0ABN9YYI9_9LACO|nr:MFS transporter [Fructobacillus fructosus]MBD9366510.1 MFS transporter [Leuconostoc mesenteroides]KRN52919.1 major facilitator superfamily permease [Fructobacillus fructosus KCTC 3544]MBC9119256.1 MFS transporter [Fructobacillus fructosus]MCK8638902.1 MFS transporter [Fructobacillus fructosus]CAK1242420.1 MFS family (AraJ) [Fructobacillus fructosus]